jgi:hypothetical protein
MATYSEAGVAGIAARAPASEIAESSRAQLLQNAIAPRALQALLSAGVAVWHMIEIERSSVALTPDGITIGTFRRRQQAFKAISEHERRP